MSGRRVNQVVPRVRVTVPAAFDRFRVDRSGGALILFGLMLPVLMGLCGAAVDYTVWNFQRTKLQGAADLAALSAAKELAVSQYSAARSQAVAQGSVHSLLDRERDRVGLRVEATSPDQQSVIQVRVSQPRQTRFSHLIFDVPERLEVKSEALLHGKRKLCVIALDQNSADTIYLKSNSWLTARDCDIHSNSVSSSGISTDSGIQVTAMRTCSRGGYRGQGVFRGERASDCPNVKDPLTDRAPPGIGLCRVDNKPVIDQGSLGARHRLQPGTYCGGLFIGGNSAVEFAPGEYVIKDGPLTIDSNADVQGDDVGFYLTGKDAVFQFVSNARINLDAPRVGPLAGLLIFEDRAAPPLREHAIKTNFASNMTGTIYLPRGRFVIDATNDVAQQSAFTVIVSLQLLLTANPKLVLNTNYSQTSVPVPTGLGQLGGEVRLSQ
jgi:hypothetical protein